MVDARLPERYLSDRRILRLTDSERSSLFIATLWAVSNRTDGRIERADLDLIPMFRSASVNTLVIHGLWLPDGEDAWTIADYSRDQTTRHEFEVLENNRRRERTKKARQRARQSVPGEVPPGQSPGTAQEGQARQEGQEGRDIDPGTGEVHDWATRTPGEPTTWVENDNGGWSAA